MAAIIVLFTDFGLEGPYTGQVKTVLHQIAPGVPVVDLFADLPAAKPQPAAYLLAAYGGWFPPGTVILAVVDPGVGGERAAVVVEADSPLVCRSGQRLVGARHAARRPRPELGDLRAARRRYRQAFTAAICSPR